MSSPVQECSMTENDNGNGAVKLTKSQRNNRRQKALKQKRKANLELLGKGEDTENPKSKPEVQFYTISPASLQDDPSNGIGTSATVDKKLAILSPDATGDEKSLKFKGKELIKVVNWEMGSSMPTNLNGEVKVQKKMETTIGETSPGTSATDNTSSKKRKRKRKKMNNNPDLGDILSTHESTQGLSMTKVFGVESNGTGSGKIATPDANMVSKGDHTEVASGKIGESETLNLNVNGKNEKKTKLESKNKRPTLRENLSPQYLQNLEAAKGETGSGTTSTDKPASKKQKRQKLNTNPDLGDILSTHESTQEGLSTTKVLEVKSGETVSGKTATCDANMVLKGEDHTVAVNGKMQENGTNNLNVNGKGKKKKRRKSKNKSPTLGENLNPHSIENLEAAKHETGSGTTATDSPASEKQMRQKLNTKPDLGDILSTHESKQEGLSTTKVLEVKSGGTVSVKTATSDANMVSKREDHTEVANGKMVESETTNLNVNSNVKKKKTKLESKNKRPTLREILSPQYLQNLEAAKGETGSGTTSTDKPASKKQKRQKLNTNPDLGDILSTHESTQEGLSTTKVLEVKSGETVSGKTATCDANMVLKGEDHTVAVNGKMQENGTNNLNVNGKGKKKKRRKSKNKSPTLGENLNPHSIENLEAAKHETGSGTTATDSPASEKQMRQKLNTKPDLGDILSTHESKQEGLSTTKVLEVKSGGTVSVKTATSDANMVSKREDHTEVANGKMVESETTNLNVNSNVKKKKTKLESKNKRPTLREILSPQYLQNLEAAKGETGSGTTSTDKPASKKQKRQKLNTNPDLGDILSTHESTQEGLSTTKVLEVKSGETVSGKTATCDANMVLKGEDHTVVVNGKMQENGTNNLNVNGKGKKKKRRKSKNKSPTLGENLNPQSIENLEAAKHETGSGTTATNNTTSKKQKRQKINNNTASADMLSTCENTQDKAIAKKDLSTNKVLKEVSGEKASQGEEHMKDANGKTDLKANTILNVSDVGRNKNNPEDPKSRIPEIFSGEKCRSTIGNAESTMLKSIVCTQAFNGEASSSKKSKKRKNQDTIIMNKGSSTAESEREDFQEIVNGEKCPSTIADAESTMLKSTWCLQVANSEMCSTTIVLKTAETADLETAEAKANTALSLKRQKMGVKEINQVATGGKKLLIFDVNGLLADVVSDRPKDIEADKYITRRAIFKRPYLDDFLCFCFERFTVGIWSSRTMRNLNPVVDFLLGDLKKKLLFLWDGSKCTNSGIKTLEEKYKYLVVKDLRKIWDEDGPGNSWVKGAFHESNTLLVDDSPYKALLNPKYTGIFPASYSYKNRDDNFLGTKGDLQTYLEGLAAADDVKTYVEQHPFGLGAIDEKSPHWAFYSRVIRCLNGRTESRNSHLRW